MTYQHTRTVGHAIGKIHAKRILIDQGSIPQPIGDGIFLLRTFYDERFFGIKVKSLYLRKDGISITEIERETVRHLALCLQEISVCQRFRKSPEHHVIRQEMGIFHLVNRLDVQRVYPCGILSDIRLAGWYDDVMGEGDFLTLLIKHIVAVHVLQGIDAIRARRYALDDETSSTVRTAYTQHRLGLERRISLIIIETYENTLDRFQILSLQHISRNLHRINDGTCRKTIGIVAHRISLVVVADSIREVDSISGIGFQRIDKRNMNTLSCAFDFRHFELRRRNHHLLGRIIHLDKLIEVNIYLLLLHIDSTVSWRGTYHLRWCLVKPSSVRLSHSCTGSQQEEDRQIERQKQGI